MYNTHKEFINVYSEFSHHLNVDELITESPCFDSLTLQLNMSDNDTISYILDRLQIYNELYPKSSIHDMNEAICLHIKYLFQFIYKLGYQKIPFVVLSYLLNTDFIKPKIIYDIYNTANAYNHEIYFILLYITYKEELNAQNDEFLVDSMNDFNLLEEEDSPTINKNNNHKLSPSTDTFMNHAIIHNLYNCILWMKEIGFDVHDHNYYITLAKHNYLDSLALLLESNHEMINNLELIREIEYTIREKYVNEFNSSADLYILDESKYKQTICVENQHISHKYYKYEYCCNCGDQCYGCVCLKILSNLENIILKKKYNNNFSKNEYYF